MPLVSLYAVCQLSWCSPIKLSKGLLSARGQRASLPWLQPLGEHIGYADKAITWSLNQKAIFVPWDWKAGAAILPTFIATKTWDPFKRFSRMYLRHCLWQLMSLRGNFQLRTRAYQRIQPTVFWETHTTWEMGINLKVFLSLHLTLHFFLKQLCWDLIYLKWNALILSVPFNVLALCIHM